jgi:NitT/TauT family transport system substrate-binding protein
MVIRREDREVRMLTFDPRGAGRLSRRRLLAGSLTATMVVALPSFASACSPSRAPAAATPAAEQAAPTAASLATVRVGTLGTIGDAGWWLAQDGGYLRDQGLDFVNTAFTNAPDQISPLANGQLDVGGGAISAGLFNAIARGIPLKAVADKASDRPGHGTVGLLVRQDLWDSGKIVSPADVKGLRIGIASKGVAVETSLNNFLQTGGISVQDLDVVALSFPDQVTALAQGGIDLALTPEPSLTTAAARGFAHIWLRSDAMLAGHITAALMYSPKFAAEQTSLAQRLMVAYLHGVRDYNDAFFKNVAGARSKAIEAFIKYTPLKDPAVYEQIVYTGLDPDGKIPLDSLEKDQEYFVGSAQQQQRINLGDVLDMSFAEDAVRRLGPYG